MQRWQHNLVKCALAAVCGLHAGTPGAAQSRPDDDAAPFRKTVAQYCLGCHSSAVKTAGLDLESLAAAMVSHDTGTWEGVVRKLRGRQMPPVGMPKPDEAEYGAALESLTLELDGLASSDPSPGRTPTFRRLNRTEYRNAIRELLALQVNVNDLLPSDEASHGFDNITVSDLPPLLLERYVSAAEKISRLAVGRVGRLPDAVTIRLPPDLTQEQHIPGLPIGTRGGALVPHTFPVDGEYEISVRLARDRNEDIEGLGRPYQLELLVDRERLALLEVKPPPRGDDERNADRHLRARFNLKAGPHDIGATFLKDSSFLVETQRKPYQARFNFYRHRRVQPAIFSITITGPYASSGPGETPSRDRIFVCRPASAGEEDACAEKIVRNLATTAYRRPVSAADVSGPLGFYRQARAETDGEEGFDAAIERALAAVLVSPNFLFRIERDPAGIASGTAYQISDLELASRLSFFLWSSLPDAPLRDSAVQGRLRDPAVLEGHVRRMLADRRSDSLIDNFSSQWLHLRNLASVRPDMRIFPDFDDNLRQAFQRETELLLEDVIRQDRSVLDLLRSKHTFVNERLAKHYGIPHIYGGHFRRVNLAPDSVRGGLLRHGSILTVTSYATRTSPVIRGKWILENILGMPPPPPPADVPELKETTISGKLSVRERLAEHRANPACASCHNPMDPLGFALENYDAVGRWRTDDGGEPIDPSGELADGTRVADVADLERALLGRPELFASALAEKLLTFALGRGVEHHDAPAIRQIVRTARDDNFRFSSLILGIASSTPFQMRRSR
ncbi:MAG: DUF1592 domain-containing protein [Bryobacterales bacterium]|nr:DUF1592 domain-containing protein [Bryobacterales bacterium]MDE0623482.1 DUF1592 domain-containing protein [Bryobacterales bacterium]